MEIFINIQNQSLILVIIMRKLAVFLITAILMASIVPAYCMDGVIWEKTYDIERSTYEYGAGITTDNSDNVIVGGVGSEGALIKYGPSGNVLWDIGNNVFTLTNIYDVATDSSGNIIFGGSGVFGKMGPNGLPVIWGISTDGSIESVAVDSNDNVLAINSGYILWKTDTNGNILPEFPKSFVGIISEPHVSVDSKNNIILTGYLDDTVRSIITLKLAPNGALIWQKIYEPSGNGGQGRDVTVDPDDNIVVTGYYNNDIITIKYDSNGNLIWAKTFSVAPKDSLGDGVATDSNGNIFVAGTFDYFNTEKSADYPRWIILKYDSNGNLVWTKINSSVDYSYANAITVDSENNIIATGTINVENPSYKEFIYTVKYQGEQKKKGLPIEFILKILKNNKNK